MRIAVLITTHQRGHMLLPLLQQINAQLENSPLEVKVLVVADGPQQGYKPVADYLHLHFNTTMRTTPHHNGKAGYFKTINALYAWLRDENRKKHFDFVFQVPDDIKLCDNFFETAINAYKQISDVNCVCLNLINDGRSQPGWTNCRPKDVSFGNTDFILTNWVDMCFLSKISFFTALDWQINDIDLKWSSDPNKSSGVGRQISSRLFAKHYSMYMVYDSLIEHGIHESVMHPLHRKLVPLVSKVGNVRKIAGIASLYGRANSLKETVESLINQVDELHITLNGYTETPYFLSHPKIHVTIDPSNSLGDAAKFSGIVDKQGYLFTCDDDIIYPTDYVRKFVDFLNQHQRKIIATIHGRRFKTMPVKSYYHCNAFTVRCTGSLRKIEQLHIPGTGVMAFHSDVINLEMSDFKAANMADIWIGIAANTQNVPVLAMQHECNWVVESKSYNNQHTIFQACHANDEFQTVTVNSVIWDLQIK